MGFHGEAVFGAAKTDDDIAQGLAAKINDKADIDTFRVDVEAAFFAQSEQRFIIIITFMLHAGGKRGHGEVVCIGDGIDVARESEGILR